MLGTKWVVNASGAALDAARYYGYVSRLPPKDAFIPPRDVFIRPSLSIRGRAPSPRRAAVIHGNCCSVCSNMLGKFSARARKRCASFPEAKETKKKRNMTHATAGQTSVGEAVSVWGPPEQSAPEHAPRSRFGAPGTGNTGTRNTGTATRGTRVPACSA